MARIYLIYLIFTSICFSWQMPFPKVLFVSFQLQMNRSIRLPQNPQPLLQMILKIWGDNLRLLILDLQMFSALGLVWISPFCSPLQIVCVHPIWIIAYNSTLGSSKREKLFHFRANASNKLFSRLDSSLFFFWQQILFFKLRGLLLPAFFLVGNYTTIKDPSHVEH